MRFNVLWLSLLLVPVACSAGPAPQEAPRPQVSAQLKSQPLPVKAVVVSMFEYGELTGDRPGEFQLWVERFPLSQNFDFPMGEYPLRYHPSGVLGVCVGGGIPNATASIMALGMDPRFDLSQAYWLVAGISGGDPEDVSLGSGVWATHVVDGDLLYEIDAREIPDDWPYGMIPLGGSEPASTPEDIATGWTVDTSHFALNATLARWALSVSKESLAGDTVEMRQFRKDFKEYPNARRAPFMMLGDTLSSSTYWHGQLLNQWANDWVRLYAGEGANFVTSNMEDSGTLTALHRLARVGRVDADRVMVLRTVSNYTFPPSGRSAAWSATADYPNNGFPALETAYVAGKAVIDELVAGWSEYQTGLPGNDSNEATP